MGFPDTIGLFFIFVVNSQNLAACAPPFFCTENGTVYNICNVRNLTAVHMVMHGKTAPTIWFLLNEFVETHLYGVHIHTVLTFFLTFTYL